MLMISKEFFLTSPVSFTGYNSSNRLLPNMFSSRTILNLPDLLSEWDREALISRLSGTFYIQQLHFLNGLWVAWETISYQWLNLLLPGNNSYIHPPRELVYEVLIFTTPTAFSFQGTQTLFNWLLVWLWILIFISPNHPYQQ